MHKANPKALVAVKGANIEIKMYFIIINLAAQLEQLTNNQFE